MRSNNYNFLKKKVYKKINLREDIDILLKLCKKQNEKFYFGNTIYNSNQSRDLGKFIYQKFYKRLLAPNDSKINLTTKLYELFRAKNPEIFDQTWKIRNIENGQIKITKAFSEKVINLNSREYTLNFPYQSQFKVGDTIAYEVSTSWVNDDYIYFSGNTLIEQQKELIRFYFNIKPDVESIKMLLSKILDELNRLKIGFLVKFLVNTNLYIVADAVVLYIEKKYSYSCIEALGRIYFSIKNSLRDDVPLFTYKIRPGIGFAEEPNENIHDLENLSFGTDRCALIAKILLAVKNLDVEDIVSEIKKQGWKENEFYLNKNSKIINKTPFFNANTYFEINIDSNNYALRGAVDIGYFITSQVNNISNDFYWVRFNTHTSSSSEKSGLWLKNGSLGIAFFLIQLYKKYPDSLFKRTARKIIVNVAEKIIDSNYEFSKNYSFYENEIGWFYVLLQFIALDDNYTENSDDIDTLKSFRPEDVNIIEEAALKIDAKIRFTANTNYDITFLNGLSSYLIILINFIKKGFDPIGGASTIGFIANYIFENASNTNVGLGEGVSGVALALFEYYRYSKDEKFKDKVIELISNEDSKISTKSLGWGVYSSNAIYVTDLSWSLGASGIGFVRLWLVNNKMSSKLPNAGNIDLALTVCLKYFNIEPDDEPFDYSLDKGIGGVIDFIVFAKYYLEKDYSTIASSVKYKITAESLTMWAEKMYNSHIKIGQFPKFSDDDYHFPNYGLFDGIAGLGYLLLRINDPTDTPSILFPVVED